MPNSSPLPYYLDPAGLDVFLRRALEADIGAGDVTTLATVDAHSEVTAAFVARETGIVAGLYLAARVFALLDHATRISWSYMDGEGMQPGDTLGTICGRAHTILKGERLALNLVHRMSGIATATHLLARAAHPVRVRDTRKTAPGLNLLDKWAVRIGGGENHRLGLYDRMLVKDNHVTAAGGIAPAIRLACEYRDRHAPGMLVEVEVRTHAELLEALATGGFQELLLDNMVTVSAEGAVDTSRLSAAVAQIGGRYTTEASGNVTPHTARAIAFTGVDYVSCGALTHSVRAMDIALEFLHGNDNGN